MPLTTTATDDDNFFLHDGNINYPKNDDDDDDHDEKKSDDNKKNDILNGNNNANNDIVVSNNINNHRNNKGGSGSKGKRRPPRTTPKKWGKNRKGSSRGSSGSKGAGSFSDLINRRSNNSNNGFHQGNNNNNQNDEKSEKSNNTTPSNIVCGSVALTRDLSDLSGSYLNGNTPPRADSQNHHHQTSQDGGKNGADHSMTSHQRPWRQAKILSSREPMHPQPPQDCDDSVGQIRKAMVMIDQQEDVVEVVNPSKQQQDVSVGSSLEYDHCRTPLLILLMDPGRKTYELMQIWIDITDDTVRDILHAIQKNLGDDWRQDYDGLFQVRNKQFSQLIHILNVSTYDVQPYELWVAKPWSMAAKTTVTYGGAALNQLMQLGVLKYTLAADNAATFSSKVAKDKMDDSILVLSIEARARIYVPGGVMKHYHACQFLSFSPPFEPTPTPATNATPTNSAALRVDVLGGDGDDGSASQLSESNCTSTSMLSEDKSLVGASSSQGQQLLHPRQFKAMAEKAAAAFVASTSNDSTPKHQRQTTQDFTDRSPTETSDSASTASNNNNSINNGYGNSKKVQDISFRSMGSYGDGSQRLGGSSTGTSGRRLSSSGGGQGTRGGGGIAWGFFGFNCGMCRRRTDDQVILAGMGPQHVQLPDAETLRIVNNHHDGNGSHVLDSEVGAVWRVWEAGEEDSTTTSKAEEQSIISDSAPLLTTIKAVGGGGGLADRLTTMSNNDDKKLPTEGGALEVAEV